MPTRRLLELLGGRPGVQAAVVDLYARLLDDDAVAPYFDDVDLQALRAHMVDFLAAAVTGAAHGYGGLPLDRAHRGLGVTEDAFTRVVGHLVAVLADADVGQDVIDEVVALLAPLRSLVVA